MHLSPIGAGALVAQLPTVRFESLGASDGLSNVFAYRLIESAQGYIWIGTQDGVNRYDGASFSVFRNDPADSSSLSDKAVASLFEDTDGYIWVGFFEAGLNRLDPRTGVATRYPMADLGPWRAENGAPRADPRGRDVRAVVGDRRGLILGTDAGLVWFDRDSTTYRALEDDRDPARLPVTVLSIDAGGRLWVGRGDGTIEVFEWTTGGERGLSRTHASTVLPAEVSAIERGTGETVWIATRGAGVFEVRASDLGVVGRYSAAATGSRSLLSDRVQDVLLDGDGYLWISTVDGLSVLPPSSDRLTHFTHSEGTTYTLPHSEVLGLLEDRAGSLWVGTWDGIARASPHRGAIQFFPIRGDADVGVSEAVVAIEQARDGSVWLGTWGGGVDLLELSTGAIRRLGADPRDPLRLSHASVFGLATDVTNSLWIATLGGGVNRLDTESGEVLRAGPGADEGAGARVPSVFVDGTGVVWSGSQTSGLHRFDTALGRFLRYGGPDGDWTFGSDYVWPIIEDKGGNLWVGAFEGGLGRIDPSRERLKLFTPDNSGLSDSRILTLYEDPDGIIWIGTQGGGLIRLDPAREAFDVFTIEDGLPHDHVEGIVTDNFGYLWVSTNGGLARFDPSNGEFWTLTASAGLQDDRFYANSVSKSADGKLFFGGAGGLSVIDPGKLERGSAGPPLVLTGLAVNAEERPLGVWADGSSRLVLEPEENFFTFEFAALDFVDRSRNRYRYQLKGLDREPREGTTANYTSVPPGTYTFVVSAVGSDGVWNDEGLQIPLRVKPPFTATWWFRLLVVSAIAGVVALAANYRTRQLLRVERVRLRIAGDLHDDIGASLSSIALRAQMARRDEGGSVTRQRLEEVEALARGTVETLQEMVWMVNTDYDSVAQLVRHLEDSTSTLLEGVFEYAFIAPSDLPEHSIPMEVRDNVSQLFRGALKNVVDHSNAGHVEIEVAYDRPRFRLRVTDDGVGFDRDGTPPGTGIKLMEKRAVRYGADLVVRSEPGAGTTVEFSIDLG